MFSLVFASHPQALSLFLLPLVASAGHHDAALKRVHQAAQAQVAFAAPMLLPASAMSCKLIAVNDGGMNDRYVIVPATAID